MWPGNVILNHGLAKFCWVSQMFYLRFYTAHTSFQETNLSYFSFRYSIQRDLSRNWPSGVNHSARKWWLSPCSLKFWTNSKFSILYGHWIAAVSYRKLIHETGSSYFGTQTATWVHSACAGTLRIHRLSCFGGEGSVGWWSSTCCSTFTECSWWSSSPWSTSFSTSFLFFLSTMKNSGCKEFKIP